MLGLVASLLLLISLSPQALADSTPTTIASENGNSLQSALASPLRSQKNRARDLYRHPLETLQFFGLRPEMTVVELWPGSGWYTEILAPFLAPKGQLIVSSLDPKLNRASQTFQEKLSANSTAFGKVKVVQIDPPTQLTLAPPNTVDLVLTFRNIHNWISAGYAEQVYKAAFKALKPGGILGLEEHRAKSGSPLTESAKTGYLPEADVIAALEKVGFKLLGKSEINANPKDTKNYSGGVWTLPPTLSQGEKDKAQYVSIGESDRMTLKFIKPKGP